MEDRHGAIPPSRQKIEEPPLELDRLEQRVLDAASFSTTSTSVGSPWEFERVMLTHQTP
jgi:hypothetical protein